MALGPIEVLVIAFPGNKFNGAIIPEMQKLIDQNIVSVVDALLVLKDAAGEVTFVEFDEEGLDPDAAVLAGMFDHANSLISDDDVLEFAAGLEPNSSAALLIVEHTWSKPFRDAIVASGGQLALNFRVPGLVVEELLAELPAAE